MPLEPLERAVVLTHYNKTKDAQECIQALGSRMSKIGKLPDAQMLDLFEALKEKSDLLENIVLELVEKGYLENTDGTAKMLVDMCLQPDNN